MGNGRTILTMKNRVIVTKFGPWRDKWTCSYFAIYVPLEDSFLKQIGRVTNCRVTGLTFG